MAMHNGIVDTGTYYQRPFQDPTLEVPTIYKAYFKAYVREYPHKIWPKIWYSSTVPPF